MDIKSKLREYTDDDTLVIVLDNLIYFFTSIRNSYDLLTCSMESIMEIPGITIEMCQLIHEIKNNPMEWESYEKENRPEYC